MKEEREWGVVSQDRFSVVIVVMQAAMNSFSVKCKYMPASTLKITKNTSWLNSTLQLHEDGVQQAS